MRENDFAPSVENKNDFALMSQELLILILIIVFGNFYISDHIMKFNEI